MTVLIQGTAVPEEDTFMLELTCPERARRDRRAAISAYWQV